MTLQAALSPRFPLTDLVPCLQPQIVSSKTVPSDLMQAIATLAWAASRVPIDELNKASALFGLLLAVRSVVSAALLFVLFGCLKCDVVRFCVAVAAGGIAA